MLNELDSVKREVESKLKLSEDKMNKIEGCKHFIETESVLQEQKIQDLSEIIQSKNETILGLKRQIVALEAKQESLQYGKFDLEKKIIDTHENKKLKIAKYYDTY